eukprot:TRINITY_DN65921_c0_g1_i1.p1 TRINITY_DN65921_c0_g1~~TRINITY_DN65921_c0_g1_i1.p1  ORF type:complete len:247 (+),score=35.33 TRINITY_DN65921_c0_g1_i1:124-864(+)
MYLTPTDTRVCLVLFLTLNSALFAAAARRVSASNSTLELTTGGEPLACEGSIWEYYNVLTAGKYSPKEACRGMSMHGGSNKLCCRACPNEGYGFCFTKEAQRRHVQDKHGKTSIDRELFNLYDFTSKFNVRVVEVSDKVVMRSKSAKEKTYEGYVVEWLDAAEVHPVSDAQWVEQFKAAARDSAAKSTLQSTLKQVQKVAKNHGWKVVDFQGFVMPDGTFVAADLGSIRANDEWHKKVQLAVDSLT